MIDGPWAYPIYNIRINDIIFDDYGYYPRPTIKQNLRRSVQSTIANMILEPPRQLKGNESDLLGSHKKGKRAKRRMNHP